MHSLNISPPNKFTQNLDRESQMNIFLDEYFGKENKKIVTRDDLEAILGKFK